MLLLTAPTLCSIGRADVTPPTAPAPAMHWLGVHVSLSHPRKVKSRPESHEPTASSCLNNSGGCSDPVGDLRGCSVPNGCSDPRGCTDLKGCSVPSGGGASALIFVGAAVVVVLVVLTFLAIRARANTSPNIEQPQPYTTLAQREPPWKAAAERVADATFSEEISVASGVPLIPVSAGGAGSISIDLDDVRPTSTGLTRAHFRMQVTDPQGRVVAEASEWSSDFRDRANPDARWEASFRAACLSACHRLLTQIPLRDLAVTQ